MNRPPPLMRATARRLDGNPIIRNFADRRIGANVNGPSLIRTTDWMTGRLGRYHLYFAHHLGSHIRQAYADRLDGPWATHTPGTLDICQMPWLYDHCASPDVHVDHDRREVRMYVHGVSSPEPWRDPVQSSYVALSSDSVRFTPLPARLGASYFRVWQWDQSYFALSLGGRLWRASDATGPFERGPRLAGLPANTRHLAVLPKAGGLWVAWSVIGDCPERIYVGLVQLARDWSGWSLGHVQEVLRPAEDWEGAGLEPRPSEAGLAQAPVHQLRDPAFYSEDGRDYLLYAVAGEAGIAIAEFRIDGGT